MDDQNTHKEIDHKLCFILSALQELLDPNRDHNDQFPVANLQLITWHLELCLEAFQQMKAYGSEPQ